MSLSQRFNQLFFWVKIQIFPPPIILLECQIHGGQYYDCPDLLKNLQLVLKEELVLKREPKNPYDSFAIEVWTKYHKKLGYVPKRHNQVIAKLMDQQQKISAHIKYIRLAQWNPVVIQIELRA